MSEEELRELLRRFTVEEPLRYEGGPLGKWECWYCEGVEEWNLSLARRLPVKHEPDCPWLQARQMFPAKEESQ